MMDKYNSILCFVLAVTFFVTTYFNYLTTQTLIKRIEYLEEQVRKCKIVLQVDLKTLDEREKKEGRLK